MLGLPRHVTSPAPALPSPRLHAQPLQTRWVFSSKNCIFGKYFVNEARQGCSRGGDIPRAEGRRSPRLFFLSSPPPSPLPPPLPHPAHFLLAPQQHENAPATSGPVEAPFPALLGIDFGSNKVRPSSSSCFSKSTRAGATGGREKKGGQNSIY